MTYFLQLGEGDEYGDLAPVIFVGLLDFEVFLVNRIIPFSFAAADAIESASAGLTPEHRNTLSGRTGRWAGRLVQVQNLPRNYIGTLDEATFH